VINGSRVFGGHAKTREEDLVNPKGTLVAAILKLYWSQALTQGEGQRLCFVK